MLVLINKRWVQPEDARISIFSTGLMYGQGIFETLRTYPQKKIFQLDAHLKRLIVSAEKAGLDALYSFEEIKGMVLKVAAKSEHDQQRIKLLLIPKNFIIISSPLSLDSETSKGVSLKSLTLKRALPEIKSVSYLDCLLAHNKARQAGYFEALLMDKHEYIYEGSRSNIFWIDRDTLHTREKDVLPGITREFIIENSPLEIKFQNIKYQDLITQKSLFITNSVMGIVPALQIDDFQINKMEISPSLRLFMNWFHSVLP